MENVYDIKRKKNLNFILPKEVCLPGASKIGKSKIVVAIHLHYMEKISEYLQYILNIPLEADIIFTTSQWEVKKELETYQKRINQNIQIIEKDNRGRDVSALLVACREELMKYEYVCFVHDKKAKSKDTVTDIETFVKCLWENTLGSNEYIKNIIYTFETHPSLGLLLPPEAFSDNQKFAYVNTWDCDYELMKSLSEKLQLQCDLDLQKKPLSLGTVFWARTDALRKLFEWKWCYKDFDEEPLPADGTISHAIERSFAYVAQDAGYETGIVMTDEFAGKRQDAMQDVMTEAFKMLKSALGIQTIGELKRGNQTYESMIDFAKKFSKLFVYGAGEYGQACVKILGTVSIQIESYIVSKKGKDIETVNQLPVKEFSEISLNDGTGIIIAVNNHYRQEIIETIRQKKSDFKNLYIFLSHDICSSE